MAKKKILLIEGPAFPHRADELISHLAVLGQEEIEVVKLATEPPGPDTIGGILFRICEEQPSVVVFTSTGYDKAAARLREVAQRWPIAPDIALISADPLDLEQVSGRGFAVIADDRDGHQNDFPNLSDGAAVLRTLHLSS